MHAAGIPKDIPLCLDGRMLADGGTGVATYARSLRAAQAGMGNPSMILSARPAPRLLPPWLVAVSLGQQRIRAETGDDGAPLLCGADLYRRAHVHFGYWRRLYRLHCPMMPFGIMHWSYPVPIHMEGWINLYTVHDMIPIDRPDLTPIEPRRHLAVLHKIAAEADRIITVSQSAALSIVAGLGCDAGLVTNCGLASDIDVESQEATQPDAALPGGLAPDGYLLIVGSVEPRKNIAAMLDAYRASNLSIPLVLAGPDGWHADAFHQAIADTPGVLRLPYLSRTALLNLIKGARGLLFASLAEGFGLPMIEAMALGTPVLASHYGALAENADGAALLVDPSDIDAMRVAIAQLATDSALRGRLRELGRARATNFSGDIFARRLEAAYHDALRARHPAPRRHPLRLAGKGDAPPDRHRRL